MSRVRPLCLAALLAFVVSSGWAQRDFSAVEIKTTHVAGNIYMLEGAGGNIGVSVGDDGILIVDDQFAPLAEKIKAALEDIGAGDLAFVVNTHWHRDHTDGNIVFGHEATIIAHENVRRRLESGADLPNRKREPVPPVALPVITFDASLSIHFNGEEIKAIHFPNGHTDGDCVVFFTRSNVVHMGDQFFAGRFPFVDLDSGGDVEGLAEDIGGILERLPDGVMLIPGHGPLSTVEDLRLYHTMLVETIGVVQSAMDRGENLSDIKDAGLPDKWQSWGSEFVSEDRWIDIIYRSLSR